MTPFEEFIYTQPDGPYTSWLAMTSEKRDFERWLAQNIHLFGIARIFGRSVSVLDLGCSWGSTSFRIYRVLRSLGLEIEYTGVDPYRLQLDRFRQLADESGLTGIRLVEAGSESYVPDREYDLVIASHSLYYTSDMRLALQKIVQAGHEAVIVHHGPRGINSVHEAFGEHVKPGPHVISTDADVAACLQTIDLQGRLVGRGGFPSTVDVTPCIMDTQHGRNLISFFLERGFDTISPEIIEAVRRFLRQTYAPHYQMTHDVGIFTLTQSRALA
jgi:hypothetical protein